jgi:hypothetical protein
VGRSSCGKGRSLAVGRLEPGTPPEKIHPPPKEGYLPHPPLKGCKKMHDRSVYESLL